MVKIVVRSKSYTSIATSHEPQAPTRGGFLLQPLYHKSANISSPLTDQKVIRCNQRLRPSEPRTHDSKIPNHDLPNRTWLKWKYVLHQQTPRHYYRPNSTITTQNMRCCSQRLRAASLYANFWRFRVNLPAIRWAKIRSVHWIKRSSIIP